MIRIGMIGMSPGNAHPYSWSAIINGCYDEKEIRKIGHGPMADYLNENKDSVGINGAKVTHVWAQEQSIAHSIASSSNIDNVVDMYEDMIGSVDAVIIGRDDPETHAEMARPFIEANVPIFVDKPLATTKSDLLYFKKCIDNGKLIMSCSSMRYARETELALQEIPKLGEIELVVAVGKKDWVKYGVHMLEAVFTMLGDPKPITVWSVGDKDRSIVKIEFDSGIVATVHLFMNISSTFQVLLYGSDDFRSYNLKDYFYMFRSNLEVFIESVQEGKSLLPFDKTYNIINTVIAGIESFETGEKIKL